MVMAAQLSARQGLISASFAQRLRRLIEQAGLPVQGPPLGVDRYLELMGHDKKTEGGELRFVLIERPGRAGLHRVPDSAVREILTECAG